MLQSITDVGRLVSMAIDGAKGRSKGLAASPFFLEIKRLEQSQGEEVRAKVLREVLQSLVESNRAEIRHLPFPPLVHGKIHDDFDRVLASLRSEPDRYFNLDRHAFRCDICVLCFSRIPVGIADLEVGGVPRSLLYCGGIGQGVRFLRLLGKTRGWAPFYVTHMRPHGVNPYNFLLVNSPENRDAMYANVAACLRHNDRIRGYLTSSWWNDPQLDRINDRFQYMRQRIVENGGYLFRYRQSEGAARDALANSAVRQKLYASGQYQPTSYACVWPRDAMIDWANRYLAGKADA